MLNHSCTHIYLILQLHILNIIEVNLFISCKKKHLYYWKGQYYDAAGLDCTKKCSHYKQTKRTLIRKRERERESSETNKIPHACSLTHKHAGPI